MKPVAVFDGAYAKKKFTDGIAEQTDLHLISKLRKDADLRYIYTGPPRKGGKGRQKIYDGKVRCSRFTGITKPGSGLNSCSGTLSSIPRA